MKRGKNLAQRLTLPQEVVSQGPLAELHGNTSVCIENHGGILEYTRYADRQRLRAAHPAHDAAARGDRRDDPLRRGVLR